MISACAEAALQFYSRITPTERGGYRLARLVRRFRPRDKWIDHVTTPDDLRLKLDFSTYPDCCMAYGLYELDTARTIKRLLRAGDHFVDVGANIGYFTLLAAKIVGASGRVDAFEPHPLNRARLIEHLRQNNLIDRVRVHDVALCDRAGSAMMHMPLGKLANHGMASLFAPDGESSSVEVATARLDEVLAGTHPHLIKIDVEGAEPVAIAGMTRLLQTDDPPPVIAEYNVDAARQAGFAPREFIDRLLTIQPKYRVDRIGWRLKRVIDLDRALAGRSMANLLFSTEAT